jgi:hypothetical protein
VKTIIIIKLLINWIICKGGILVNKERIVCQVEECIYNTQKLCSAESIEVKSSGNMVVGTSAGTRCGTFEYKEGTHLKD